MSYLKFVGRLSLLGATLVAALSLAKPPEPGLLCIVSWPEARYRNYGYDHIVHIANQCSTRSICVVSTDVNPNPIEATVPAGEHVEVLTMRGSPAREFTPRVECRFAAATSS